MRLHALNGEGSRVDDFPEVLGLPAGERPARPGLALAPLLVRVDVQTAVRIETLAADSGVTPAL
ncbi:MAG: hypothetical protein LC808_32585 [Actinobacteria bacterium]|nr:hypothetical protein [Actinomycetota bacterium]